MKYIKLPIAVLAFVVSAALTLSAEEAKPEAASASAPTGSSPALKQEGHAHAVAGEKRFTATVAPDGVQHVEIVGGSYYFDPNYIIVKQNIPVELTVRKTSGYVPHDIVVKAPEAGIDFKVELKNQTQTIKFTPIKTGKYDMSCDKKLLFFKSHKDRGMDGTIEVVP